MLKKTNVEKEIQIGDLNNRNFVRSGISIFFKVIIVTFFIASITQTYVSGGYSRWFDPLMYFTTLSNIFIAVVDLIFIVLLIIQEITFKQIIKKGLLTTKLVATVSITITGIVYCFVLSWSMDKPFDTFSTCGFHIIIPLIAIIDLFTFDANMRFSKSAILWILLPLITYLIFEIICFYTNVRFYDSHTKELINAPYFFLDYSSPSGWFGFVSGSECTQKGYTSLNAIGSFWWILIITAFVAGVGFGYIYLLNLICQKANNITFKNKKPLAKTAEPTNFLLSTLSTTKKHKALSTKQPIKKNKTKTQKVEKQEESKIEDRIEPVASADISDESYNIYTSLLSKTKKIKNDEDK